MWEYKDFGSDYFVQDPIEIGGDREYLGKSFYSCNYVCPECNSHLLKSQIKSEYKGHISIETDKGKRFFSSVFYCHICNKLYTTGQIGGFNGGTVMSPGGVPLQMIGGGATLADGKVFVLSDSEEVNGTIMTIDNKYGAEVM